MRKFLFFVLVALGAAFPAGAVSWGVIGEFTQWSEDIPMTEQADGTYTVTLPSFHGDFKFRADGDWSVNLGLPTGVTSLITGNVTCPLMADGANLSFAGTVENVTLTLNPAVPSVVISGLPTDMEPIVVPEVSELYLIGGPVGWSADAGWLMSQSLPDGKYSMNVDLNADDHYAFASKLGATADDWDVLNAHRYGPASDGMVPTEGASNTLVKTADTAWKCEKSGRYRLDVDLNAMTLDVTEVKIGEVWSLIGTFNGWGAEPDADLVPTGEPDTYTVTMQSFGGEFKFRADHSWDFCFGAMDDGIIRTDGVYGLNSDGAGCNFNMPAVAPSVTFTINVSKRLLTVSGIDGSGIEDVTAPDAADAVYYNLQGIRVEAPAEGIFIKVAGGKSSKVRL